MIATTIMMKIMMKYNSIKEIITGAPSNTQHQNNTPLQKRKEKKKKKKNRLWWGVADQCTMSHGTYIYKMI